MPRIQQITSAQNPTIKHLRKLSTSASYRRSTRQTILDGVHLCESYLRAGMMPVQAVVTQDAMTYPDVRTIIDTVSAREIEIIEVPTSLFASLTSVDNGIGVLFNVTVPAADQVPLNRQALLLDTVQDPGNLGTMLRTAAAAGLRTVYLSAGTANAWSPKALRAGMGAQFVLDIYPDVDLAQLIQQSSVPVYATSLNATQGIYERDLSGDIAWLFGSEGQGVSPELLELCGDNTVIIPQDDGVESLNVAAATAICLFEQRRQQLSQ